MKITGFIVLKFKLFQNFIVCDHEILIQEFFENQIFGNNIFVKLNTLKEPNVYYTYNVNKFQF
jgi:hypothetical protein